MTSSDSSSSTGSCSHGPYTQMDVIDIDRDNATRCAYVIRAYVSPVLIPTDAESRACLLLLRFIRSSRLSLVRLLSLLLLFLFGCCGAVGLRSCRRRLTRRRRARRRASRRSGQCLLVLLRRALGCARAVRRRKLRDRHGGPPGAKWMGGWREVVSCVVAHIRTISRRRKRARRSAWLQMMLVFLFPATMPNNAQPSSPCFMLEFVCDSAHRQGEH